METTLNSKIDFIADFLLEEEAGYGFAVANNYLLINEITDQLIKEQGFKNSTKEELDAIIEKANLTEPIDELLDMI